MSFVANRVVSVALRADIGQYVAGMGQASAATKGLGETADVSTKKAKGGFDLAGKGALLMGGAVVAGLGMAVSKSMEFEKSMSAVQAATHASVGTMGALRQAAMDAGADTAYSATEAADAITEMSKAGVSAKDIVGGGLTGALSLAAAGQLDVADAAGIASVAMTQFSLSGEDLPHVADLLAAGAGKAMGSVQDLGQALNQSGLLANAAGLSIEETTGTLAAFASAGLVGSDAGTSLKTMLQMLQAPTAKSSELMDSLGISMYDANGNMLSVSEMAGQLQGGLSGLTEEQRNAALATIFGSDAVRAANVLYKEGAAGIEDWTSKVNDAGYAADTAAALQDNLSGDLEKLGGAFDTLMIQLGSGGQGPLRDVVQMLTGMVDAISWTVDAWGSLPGPVQAGVVAFTAVAALKGPVGSAMDLVSAKIASAAATMAGPNGLRAAGSGLTSFFGGPWGLAFAGATVGVSLLTTMLQNSNDATEEAKSAQQDLAAALKESEGALNDNVRAAAAKAAQDADMLNIASSAGVELGLVTDAILGNKDAYDQVTASMEAYLQERLNAVQGNTEDAGFVAAMEQVQGFKANLDELAPTVAQSAADQQQLAQAAAGTGDTMSETTEVVRDFKKEASEAKEAVDSLKAGLDALTGTTVSMFEAEAALQGAVSEATGALDGLSGSTLNADGTLNAYSESGRAAGEVLLGVRDKGNELIAMMSAQGDSADMVRAKDAELRQSFINTANQMGITGSDAERLADQILGIPEERTTRVTADTSQAETAIANLVNRSWVTHIGVKSDYSTPMLRGGTGLADGGYTGPGGKYEPAPYEVHRGEVVWSQADIAAHGGVSAVESMRRSRPRGYADGGVVGGINTIVRAEADSDSLARAATAIQSAADSLAPAAGSGSIAGGTWASIWQVVKAAIPQARQNSTYRPGDPGYHGKNKAIDFGFGSGPGGDGSTGLASIARFLYQGYGRSLAEIIYDGVGDNTPDVKNGRDHVYNAATRAEHHNHVHAAVYDQGGVLNSGSTAINLSGKPEAVLTNGQWSALERVAAAGSILAEDGSWVAADFYADTTEAVHDGMKLAEDGSWVPDSFYAGITGAVKTGVDALSDAIGSSAADNPFSNFTNLTDALKASAADNPFSNYTQLSGGGGKALPYGWNVGDVNQYGEAVPEGYTRDRYGSLVPIGWMGTGQQYISKEESAAISVKSKEIGGGSGWGSSSSTKTVQYVNNINAAASAAEVAAAVLEAQRTQEFLHA